MLTLVAPQPNCLWDESLPVEVGHKATHSRLQPSITLAGTIRRHRDGILQAIRLGINQRRTEALNNKVRLITRRACGFHSANAALAPIMLSCGPITLTPPPRITMTIAPSSPTSMPREPFFRGK